MSCDMICAEPAAKKLKLPDSIDGSYGEDKLNSTQINIVKEYGKAEDNMIVTENDNDADLLDEENNTDNENFTFPPDNDITDMLEEVEYKGWYPTITERYFTPYYKLNVQKLADDMCLLFHSNRICMLTLATSHAALQNDKQILKVDFRVSDKLDRTMNKVSGKSKHGAQPLQANSNICVITCSNDETYTIKCCMIGKLVEVNEELLEKPELLKQPPHKGGYLAIILPNIRLLEKMKENLLTRQQYESVIISAQLKCQAKH